MAPLPTIQPLAKTLDRIAVVQSALTQALTAEFQLKQPFSDIVLSGERTGIYRADAWNRASVDMVQLEGQLWLIEGVDTYSEGRVRGLQLAAWLEHSIPSLRKAVQAVDPKTQALELVNGDPTAATNYPIRIPINLSAREQNTQQRAPWTIDILAPCIITLSVKHCI